MEAIIYRRYGGPEVLERATFPTPEPAPEEVRVRVVATSINAADYRMMRADPFLARFATGLFRPPARPLLGSDVAGVVEAVGAKVARFAVGDAVFGSTFRDRRGAFAEQVCVRASSLAKKPEHVRFEAAAAIPLAGLTALQASRRIAAGQSVLVHGAGGGVGTLLVQLAKVRGATVTAIGGRQSVALLRSLGADLVLDYTRDDFTQGDSQWDVVFGVNGHQSLQVYKRHVKPNGLYMMVGGDNRQIFEALLLGGLRFRGEGRRLETLTIDSATEEADFRELEEHLASGSLRPVIDRVMPLTEVAEAMRYVEGKHVRGKVVLRVGA